MDKGREGLFSSSGSLASLVASPKGAKTRETRAIRNCAGLATVVLAGVLYFMSTDGVAPWWAARTAKVDMPALATTGYRPAHYGVPIAHNFSKRFMNLTTNPDITGKRSVWGVYPELIRGNSVGRPVPNSAVRAGLQVKLDLITDNRPRYNPSIFQIPRTSPLASVATFVATVRVGLVQNWLKQDYLPGEPSHVDYSSGHLLADSPERLNSHPRGCELVLLDKDFNVVLQQGIESSVNGHYEDCRIMYIKDQLYIYTTAYHGNLETKLWVDPWGPSATFRPLDLVVGQNARKDRLIAHGEYRAISDDASIALSDVRSALNDTVRPLLGKNHMVFEGRNDEIYMINRFMPFEIWRMVNKSSAEPVRVVDNPALKALKHFSLNGGKLVYLPELNEYLGMIHWHKHEVYEDYTQVFFTMTTEEPFEVLRLSHEFCFSSITRPDDCDYIQFVPNVDRIDDVIVVPYGRQDLEAMVATFPLADVLEMLRPIGSTTDIMSFPSQPLRVQPKPSAPLRGGTGN